ncbi:RNA polymerase sigma factor [Mucilaginibacter sp.]|jgi:RNA polymerase sigma-70 factor (ECF subfamily)|uniref:RNA polymerase sigma factor n=1 Tax=Mucilaginibacter sp. TaxID=1882438 RepID=UPI00356206A9
MPEVNSFNDNSFNEERLLLSKTSSGDELAFRRIFDRYRKKVYSYALKIIKSREQAEEILLDVFLKIWQHKNLAEIENLECYLRTITRNLAITALRRHNLELMINQELCNDWKEADNLTEETISVNETAHIFNKALDLLTPQQKLVYTLCRVEGLKYSEAAERLAISPLTVKTHMQHALRSLRAYIDIHSNAGIVVILLHIAVHHNCLG